MTRSPHSPLLRRCWTSAVDSWMAPSALRNRKASTSSAVPVLAPPTSGDHDRRGCDGPVGLYQYRAQRQSVPPPASGACRLGSADGGFGLRRLQPRQRLRERLHRHPRHGRRDRHRHRHAGDAVRQRQPGLAVRQHRRRCTAQTRRRLHRSRGRRQQHRRRRFQHRRHHLRPHPYGRRSRGLHPCRPARRCPPAVGDRRRHADHPRHHPAPAGAAGLQHLRRHRIERH